ncbi:MAG: DNA polymerase III subunit delta [bacterium]
MIIFIYGQDSFRGLEKIKELKQKFLDEVDNQGNSLSLVDGAILDLNKLNELVSTDSLFVKKRMMIIENIFNNKDKDFLTNLATYFQDRSEANNIIIFVDHSITKQEVKGRQEIVQRDHNGNEKKLTKEQLSLFSMLSKQKFVQHFAPLSNPELIGWVKERCQLHNAKITYQAIQLLISLTGDNLWLLNNEIEKLAHYKFGSRPKEISDDDPVIIEVDDVDYMVNGDLDENIFALTDALGGKNKAQAIKLLSEQVRAGMIDYYLISMLIRQFKILLQVRQCLDNGMTSRQITDELSYHPYVVRKSIDQAKNFKINSLKVIFGALVKVDYNLKNSKLPVETMIDLLIAKM